jgi:hypothetical protein
MQVCLIGSRAVAWAGNLLYMMETSRQDCSANNLISLVINIHRYCVSYKENAYRYLLLYALFPNNPPEISPPS